MEYNTLKSAIPKRYIDFFQNTNIQLILPMKPSTYDKSLNIKNLSANIYNNSKSEVTNLHHKYLKWVQELGHEFSDTFVEYVGHCQRIYKRHKCPWFSSLLDD